MSKMFHQKVKEINFTINKESKIIENLDKNESIVFQIIGQFIYETDNIFLTTNIRKVWDYFSKRIGEVFSFEDFLVILKRFNEQGLLDVKFLEPPIYSSIIVSPKLMFIYYQNFLQEFHTVLKAILFEIEEKNNDDSFKIAQNIKVKLVVVNNILDFLREQKIVELMRYSGTPLPGGKSFIILKIDEDKLKEFKEKFIAGSKAV